MGRGGARAAVGGAIGAIVLALAAGGCGAQTQPNDPRPQVPTRVSVIIGPKAVVVQPGAIANGPEKHQQIPQNQNQAQPPIKGSKVPLDVVFVTANQTGDNSKLVIHGPRNATSTPILARSPGTFQAQLPAGNYTITAAGSKASPAHLEVGAYRASSQNDLLLP
jgi:hypothetical protein